MFTQKKIVVHCFIETILCCLFFLFGLIVLGNYNFNTVVDSVIGNKFSIIQDIVRISSDYESGITLTKTFPEEAFFTEIKNDPKIDYISKGIPLYVETEDTEHTVDSENLHGDLYKLIGVDQRFFYDLVIEKVTITEGRTFLKDDLNTNSAIISKEYALLNNIKVGDKIYLEALIHSNKGEHDHVTSQLPLKVIGIFTPNKFNSLDTTSDEFKFNSAILNTNFYVPNSLVQDYRKKLLTVEVNNYPENYEGYLDPYKQKINNKEKLIENLLMEDFFEISIIPNENISLSKFRNDLTKNIKKYPYMKVIDGNSRYKKLNIFGNFSIPLFILSFVTLVIFNTISLQRIRRTTTGKLKIFVSWFTINLISIPISYFLVNKIIGGYLYLINRFSNLVPAEYEITQYYRLDKVILDNETIHKLMMLSFSETICAGVLGIMFCTLITLIINYVLQRRDANYRRLS